jgi:hypothetical protein
LADTKTAMENVGKATQDFGALGGLGAPTSEGGQFRFPATDLKDWNDQGQAAGEAWATGLYSYLSSGQASSHIENLNPKFAERLSGFLQNAPGRIEIFSGARSHERQQQLWDAALKKYGSADAARAWVAPPGRSNHESGDAADLRYSTEAVKQWAHANAEAYGLVFRLKNEDWHIEMRNQDVVKQGAQTVQESTRAQADAWTGLRDVQIENQQAVQESQAAYQAFGQIAQTAVSGLVNALADGKLEGRELAGIIGQVADQLINLAMNNIFGGQGGGGIFGALFGGGIGGGGAGVMTGLWHTGGKVGQSMNNRRVPPALFAGAPRYHSGGVAGLRPGEVPAILQRGEIVIPRGGTKPSGPGVVVNNYSTSTVKTAEKQNGKGIEVIIEERVADRINTRGTPANKAVRNAAANRLIKR